MIREEILRSFDGANVLVTGGTGLIGREIVDLLVDAGARLKVVSLDRLAPNPRASYVLGDLTDFGLCRQLTRDMDFVFHVAGIKGSIEVTKSKPASFFVPLLMMNTNMLEACRLNQVRKAVYTSSIGAYPSGELFREDADSEGAPMDMFPGWAKRMGEMQVKAYQIQYGRQDIAVVRPSNVYGPGDNFDPNNAMVIPSLMQRIGNKENPVVVWGDGSAIRDFAYSRDVAEGTILALFHGTQGGFVNLGGGRGYSIRELVETLQEVVRFDYVFDSSKPPGFPRRVMDISLARRLIGYEPTTSLFEGLSNTWAWFSQHRDEHTKKQNYFANS